MERYRGGTGRGERRLQLDGEGAVGGRAVAQPVVRVGVGARVRVRARVGGRLRVGATPNPNPNP